jgi:lysophospholipid acyltransferase (LPLAT)-like uncharacterized protein
MLRAWFKTLRIEVEPSLREILSNEHRGVIFAMWHNRIFVASHLHQAFRPRSKQLWGLVSASRDGAWQAALFRHLGVHTVRGSSSRRAAAASRQLITLANQGHDLGIAVDGPRGPAYQAQSGAAWLIQKSGNPFVLLCPTFSSAWRANSWDGYFVPKPFARIQLRAEFFNSVEELTESKDRDTVAAQLNERLRRLSEGSDPRFGL